MNLQTLRKVAKKAKKFGNGKKAESDVEPSSADDFDEAGDADSYNSSDSDVRTPSESKQRNLPTLDNCLIFLKLKFP